ncbi:MAG: hypothetical protein WC030_00260 [Candidatus Paceibacterota bacterium]
MLRLIFWIAVLLLALSFFGISIQAIINSPTGQENFGFAYQIALQIWNFILGIWHWLIALFSN